jgi:hypothetical protein
MRAGEDCGISILGVRMMWVNLDAAATAFEKRNITH